MQKKLFLLLLTLLSMQVFSQAYYPDGKKITIKYSSPKSLLDSLGIQETESYYYKNLWTVYFKRLSNKPVFIEFWGHPTPLKIKEIINSYNYSKYLNSYSYYWDVKDMIKNRTLTKSYLRDIFKEPDFKGTASLDDSEYWIYENYNARFVFNGDNVVSADIINYKAFQRNGLTISTFEVTGDGSSIGFDLSLINSGTKTIKYAFITVTATNPVNDKVGTKTLRAIGPIPPAETGSYEFENVIYSSTAKYLEIDNIKLQYMDGTFKLIPKREIQNIRFMDWEAEGHRTLDD